MTTSSIVQGIWNYCNTLREDGVSYGDYVEQLTSYYLFISIDVNEISKYSLNSKNEFMKAKIFHY